MSNLYIVATPIGNLEDITLRALRILKEVDLILCEDTRETRKLINKYEINKPLLSYHEHSDLNKVSYIVEQLKNGKNLALVSDAGTPGISDPGNRLIELLINKYQVVINIIPIPGPSALISALSISGMPTDKFIFYGFLPHKKGKETILKEIIENEYVSVFYESTHRIIKTLEKLKALGFNRGIVVCRELTKKFESIYCGKVDEILDQIKPEEVKGEFVVIVEGR
jgi:16S rRNA (cytidine1402-2'-O)-methyltransferase